MATIYEVEHEHTGERLALKVLKGHVTELDPASLERFRREARVSARVKSEHVVRVIDADVAPELGGAPFLVMDLLEGADLAEVSGDEPQEPEQVVDWLGQVARVLDKAHALGIVHRDLKPQNLFLAKRPDGSSIVKILDFGVAKIRSGEHASQTASGALIGTPLYMAPEQVEGSSSRIGPGADMWSMALIAFRLLTGHDYWKPKNVSLLLVEILNGDMAPPSARTSQLGASFDAWFRQSCQRDPETRWPDVITQVDALAEALDLPAPGARSSDADPSLAETLAQPSRGPRVRPVSPAAQSGSISAPGVQSTDRPAGHRWILPLGIAVVLAVSLLALLRVRSAPESTPKPERVLKPPPESASNPAGPTPARESLAMLPSPADSVTAATAPLPSSSSSPAGHGAKRAPAPRRIPSTASGIVASPPARRDPLADPE